MSNTTRWFKVNPGDFFEIQGTSNNGEMNGSVAFGGRSYCQLELK
jgi:hypothetical protein